MDNNILESLETGRAIACPKCFLQSRTMQRLQRFSTKQDNKCKDEKNKLTNKLQERENVATERASNFTFLSKNYGLINKYININFKLLLIGL